MKIFSTFFLIAAAGLACFCNRLFGEIIRKDGSFYVVAYAQAHSKSDNSKKSALTRAELSAQEEFARYAVAQKISLPDEVAPLEEKIKDNIFFDYISGVIKNAKLIRSQILKDGRAYCVLEIPERNLENFPAIDLKKDYKRLLEGLARNKLLRLETAQLLGYRQLLPNTSIIERCRGKLPLKSIPKSWLAKDFDESSIGGFSDGELLSAAENSVGIDDVFKKIVEEISRRGYALSASLLSSLELPLSAPLKIGESPIDASGEIALIEILSQKKSAIKFENSAEKNQYADEALSEFYKPQTDFKKVRECALRSLLLSVSDEIFNLIGRTYEEEKNWKLAALFYAQAITINGDTPYAKANLAKCLYEMQNIDPAAYWANRALESPMPPEWSAKRAREILTLIEENEKQ